MRVLDRYLRNVRIARARQFVHSDDVVIDVGCADGTMLERWKGSIRYGHGIDPILASNREEPGYTLYAGAFPDALPPIRCDVITMLAVIEHMPPATQARLPQACEALLEPGGRIVITVPSPRVDPLLHLLRRFRLVDGMSLDEHYGFRPDDVPSVFASPRLRLIVRRTFQLGHNNLFVFEKTS